MSRASIGSAHFFYRGSNVYVSCWKRESAQCAIGHRRHSRETVSRRKATWSMRKGKTELERKNRDVKADRFHR